MNLKTVNISTLDPELTWPLSEVMAISPSSFIEISLGLSMGPDSNFTSQIKSPFDLKAMMRLVFEQMAKKLPSLSMVTPAAWTNCPGRWPFPPKNHNFSFLKFYRTYRFQQLIGRFPLNRPSRCSYYQRPYLIGKAYFQDIHRI